MQFTPTSASWLNMVERFFRDLSTQQIRRGVFHSVPELITAIETHIAYHKQQKVSKTPDDLSGTCSSFRPSFCSPKQSPIVCLKRNNREVLLKRVYSYSTNTVVRILKGAT